MCFKYIPLPYSYKLNENILFQFFYCVFLNKLHFMITVELKASQTDSSKSYVVNIN